MLMESSFFPQVIKVVLAGDGASKYVKHTDCGLSSRSIILIAVAGAVGLFLMLLACCCVSEFLVLESIEKYGNSLWKKKKIPNVREKFQATPVLIDFWTKACHVAVERF